MDIRKIRYFLKKMEFVRYALYIIFTLLYGYYQIQSGVKSNELILNMATVIGAEGILIEGSIQFLARFIQSHFEDRTKLTEDYDALIFTYNRVNLIEYATTKFPGKQIAFRSKDSEPFRFEFNHELKKKRYEPPEQIKNKASNLMKAHDCSKVYNNITVRLEDCRQSGNVVKLTYSSATFYDLLITNRAMDYPLEEEKWHTVKSVRQIYEPGPFLSSLSESKLSNHLGFNGFVELADGYIIFVLQSASVSVGKRRWNPSVSASYKTSYGLNDEREMSVKCMSDAIRREIADELKIEIGENEHLEDSIFAFYRDLVEGGKPHFVFYYRLSNPIWTREHFAEHFRRETRKRKAAKKRWAMSTEEKIRYTIIEDGANFAFFSLQELKNSNLQANRLIMPNGETYKMQSDGSISLALLLKHFTA